MKNSIKPIRKAASLLAALCLMFGALSACSTGDDGKAPRVVVAERKEMLPPESEAERMPRAMELYVGPDTYVLPVAPGSALLFWDESIPEEVMPLKDGVYFYEVKIDGVWFRYAERQVLVNYGPGSTYQVRACMDDTCTAFTEAVTLDRLDIDVRAS